MKQWSLRQVLALFLAVFVTVGMGLSAVQASDMTVKMTMASDMGASGGGDCQPCPAGGDDDGAMAACPSACVAPVFALLPQALTVLAVPALRLKPSGYPPLSGEAAWPDPYPPRPSDIG